MPADQYNTEPCQLRAHAPSVQPNSWIESLLCSCAQNTDVVFTSLLKLPSGERIEMAGYAPAPLVCASRHFLTHPQHVLCSPYAPSGLSCSCTCVSGAQAQRGWRPAGAPVGGRHRGRTGAVRHRSCGVPHLALVLGHRGWQMWASWHSLSPTMRRASCSYRPANQAWRGALSTCLPRAGLADS